MAASKTGTAPHNLPADLTSFIGREREIAQIKAFVSRTRLLTLTGAGGAGKSRLALRVAAEVLRSFADGVWIVEFGSLADPNLVPERVAAAVNVPEQPGRAAALVLAEALRPKALLLVLDNCEHLAEVCASLVAELLRACPNLRILATSRVPLSVPGEALWRVPSLSLPRRTPAPAIEELGRSEAARLFIERAQAVEPAFALTRENATALGELCHRLDGMPLAIELAAARANVLSVEQIASRLDDRFRLLTGGKAAVLPRHQTLRATMDWSYGLLLPLEQVLLRRLSVFSGGWSLDAAEAVCVGDSLVSAEVLDVLASLVDKSLVLMEARQGEARYRLLETVRQYGRERLSEAEEAASVRRRHRDWCLAFAEHADAQLYTRGQASWLKRLEAEHDNLRDALEWSRAEPEGAASDLRLAGALGWFWYLYGHWTEGRAWLEGAIARAGDAPPSILPKALLGAGRITWFQGEVTKARSHFEKGLALARDLDQAGLMPGFFYWLGRLALHEDDLKRATALLEEGLANCREREDTWWACQLLAERGEVARSGGDYATAEDLWREGLAISRSTGAINNSMLFLHNLGEAALRQGRLQEAAECYAECLALYRQVQHRAIASACLDGLAWVAAGEADYARAARLFGAADTLRASLGRGSEYADREQHVARVREALGEPVFQEKIAEGRSMALEAAIDYALSPGTVPPRPRTAAGGLTSREEEVAALVVAGLSNREIAARLVVTERTAETHVQNILNKLGFSSRAQVAAWAVEQGLTKSARPQ